jgi:hypothetical protein
MNAAADKAAGLPGTGFSIGTQPLKTPPSEEG